MAKPRAIAVAGPTNWRQQSFPQRLTNSSPIAVPSLKRKHGGVFRSFHRDDSGVAVVVVAMTFVPLLGYYIQRPRKERG